MQKILPLALVLLACSPDPAMGAEPAKMPKRADSFLGIHFDFHAGPDCKEIGQNTTPEMVENIIQLVKPDYLQIDCKGHRGLSSYPTKVGNQAPGFVGDPLKVWREVTAKHGVPLYMHYSGVWDSEAIIQHPDWAARNADGSTNKNATSFFGPYADQLLIPQLRELASEYRVSGAWVDGECWASVPDYSEAAVTAFKKSTGITNVPRKPSDPNWFEFLQFNREAFRKYLRHYIQEVKKTNPEFEICSNWAYTDHMPEGVNAPVDFLSGDYSPEDSVNSARLSARYLARQGKSWDLMAWSFTRNPDSRGNREKPAVQLQREAAVVVALGGGFQAYFKQKRDGSIHADRMPVMAEVAKFCRDRQEICHRSEMVPQIALLFSTEAHYRKQNGLYSRDLNRLHGNLQALVESQHSVEVLGEHHLAGRLAQYPLIIVPEWEYLAPSFRNDLVAYVNGGGNLLLVGPGTAALFQEQLGVSQQGERSSEERTLLHNGTKVSVKGLSQNVQPRDGTRAFGQLARINAQVTQPAATIATVGKGKVAAIHFSVGQNYLADHSDVTRSFVSQLVRELFPSPLVEVTGSRDVDVCVARKNGNLLINLVNTSGPHVKAPIMDSIAPVGPVQVTAKLKQQPAKVTLEPGARPASFTYANGSLKVAVPSIEIHDIVVIHGGASGL